MSTHYVDADGHVMEDADDLFRLSFINRRLRRFSRRLFAAAEFAPDKMCRSRHNRRRSGGHIFRGTATGNGKGEQKSECGTTNHRAMYISALRTRNFSPS